MFVGGGRGGCYLVPCEKGCVGKRAWDGSSDMGMWVIDWKRARGLSGGMWVGSKPERLVSDGVILKLWIDLSEKSWFGCISGKMDGFIETMYYWLYRKTIRLSDG